uniref:Uncharacterized protein n=1 Tax=Branchiostoma floridae TaxID=7739 RepID=C3ZPG3_BRAFL|eukprot:XP_002589649.1 hypothetical protein BRAFLDRAFT_99256 [Branchiostoma floridae]
MEWDDLLRKHLGEFGRFQKFTSLLAILVGPTVGLTYVAMTFLAATPEHHYRVFGNTSSVGHRYSTEGHNLSIPLENIGGTWKYSSCLMYKNLNRTESSRNETIACTHGWEYDRTIYQSTIVTEYDLVCRRSWLRGLGQSTFMVGVSVGGIFFGITSDRRSRRDDDDDNSVSYTSPWSKRDPFRHVKRVVACYQTARDGGYFNSILVP